MKGRSDGRVSNFTEVQGKEDNYEYKNKTLADSSENFRLVVTDTEKPHDYGAFGEAGRPLYVAKAGEIK